MVHSDPISKQKQGVRQRKKYPTMVGQTVASLAVESRSSSRAVERSVDCLLLRQRAGSAGCLSEGPAIASGFGERVNAAMVMWRR